MSRCPARHAKATSRYEGRHAKPGTPVSATVIGTAAKAVPASLAAGAAGSALVLAGPASAAVVPPAGLVHTATDLAPVKAAAEGTWVAKGRHAAPRPAYTVAAGDTLSSISARFCGSAADYKALAAASGITDPNMIHAGQSVTLACHTHAHAAPSITLLAHRKHVARHHSTPPASSGSGAATQPSAPQPQAPAASTVGLSAFESCVISAESGGNPTAVNPVSGAGGLFQFLPSTWASLGFASAYPGGAQTAPSSVQEAAFSKLYAEAGTSPWAPYDGC